MDTHSISVYVVLLSMMLIYSGIFWFKLNEMFQFNLDYALLTLFIVLRQPNPAFFLVDLNMFSGIFER